MLKILLLLVQTELSSALRHEATNSARVEAVVNAMSTAEILAQVSLWCSQP